MQSFKCHLCAFETLRQSSYKVHITKKHNILDGKLEAKENSKQDIQDDINEYIKQDTNENIKQDIQLDIKEDTTDYIKQDTNENSNAIIPDNNNCYNLKDITELCNCINIKNKIYNMELQITNLIDINTKMALEIQVFKNKIVYLTEDVLDKKLNTIYKSIREMYLEIQQLDSRFSTNYNLKRN
jgi:hypothetical protein